MIYYMVYDPRTWRPLTNLLETTVNAFCKEVQTNEVGPWRTTYLGREVIIRRMFT